MTLFLDLFWQDQYLKQNSLKKPLDRDRYFMALILLLWGQFFLITISNFNPFHSMPVFFLTENAPFWGQLPLLMFYVGFQFDFILSIATLFLGFRMFPQSRIKAISLGLMNFIGMVIYRAILLAQMDQWGYSPADVIGRQFGLTIEAVILLTGVFILAWLIVNLFFLRREGLAKMQPDHPLLRLNPRRAEKHQLSAIKFMWKMMIFGLIASAVPILLFGLLHLLGGDDYYQARGWYIMVMLALVGLGIYALILLVKRILNIGWRWPFVVSSLLAFIVVFWLIFLMDDLVYYYFSGSLGTVRTDQIKTPLWKLMFLLYCLVQLALLCKPGQAKQTVSSQKEVTL